MLFFQASNHHEVEFIFFHIITKKIEIDQLVGRTPKASLYNIFMFSIKKQTYVSIK